MDRKKEWKGHPQRGEIAARRHGVAVVLGCCCGKNWIKIWGVGKMWGVVASFEP